MTNQKYVSEMNTEELENVFNNNEKLQYDVHEDMVESEMHWISEHLDCIKNYLSDWSIGDNTHCYIKVNTNKIESFIDGVIDMQEKYCVLADNENEFISAIAEKIELLNDTEMHSDQYDMLENEIESDVKQLAEKIATHYKELFNSLYEKKYQVEYFTEFYAESRLDNNAYINLDENSYTLYEDVSYTKNYSN